MAHEELEAELRKLDEELEEGDITRKGYEKRRTALLSKYFAPNEATESPSEPRRGGLRIHSAEDSDHPASRDDLRAASLLALTGGQTATPRNGSVSSYPRPTSRASTYQDQLLQVPSHAQRFLHTQLGSDRAQSLGGNEERGSSTLRPATPESPDTSRTNTMLMQNSAFRPETQDDYKAATDTRASTLLTSKQEYFVDFAGQQRDEPEDYGGYMHRYSVPEITSPIAQVAPPLLAPGDLQGGAAIHQMPLEPREVPFAICDPHDANVEMSRFDNIAMVLRYRAKTIPKQAAYWVLDQRGRELVSITWEKLASRAEKVAQVIRDKSSLYRGDRVALIYTDSEIIEFAVALCGCCIAGVVAVPINDLKNYNRLNVILTSTQAHLALTTEANLKNFQRDITAARLNWPRGVEWWKTNEFGSYHPKKKGEEPPLVVPDLAYIEFSTAPTGDLRGVVMSHKTIMHQMVTLSAMITSATSNSRADTFNPSLRDKQGHLITGSRYGETMLTYLDPRQGIGMILGVLLNVYGGHTVYYIDQRSVETPGLYAHLITKYRTTLMVADYPGLKRAAINYQADPMTTRNYKKGMEPNFSTVKLCMIDTITVDPEFHELLADRWLRPLRNNRAREIVAPMLCLPEHGGMVISMRDWLGGEERMGCSLVHGADREIEEEKKDEPATIDTSGFGSSLIGGGSKKKKEKVVEELGEVLLDKEALKTNDIVVLAMGSEAREKAGSFPNAVRCGAFGFPIPDATLAVVDPESGLLCTPNTVGEIWVDSPSLSGGFWALPRHTETIFHARPFCFKEGNPTPSALDMEFLRSGLLGCIIEGRVFVLGLYEDRLRQRVEWVEHGIAVQEHRYFFVQHLILSIMRNVPKIHDCSAFDCFVNDEHLPVIFLESAAASTAPLTSGGPPRQLDIPLLDSLAERTMEVLLQEHQLRVYCVLITAPGVLPRVIKNGRREIGNMLCRKEYDRGTLPCVHVKFGVERAVQNLAVGEDIQGGIWSPLSSTLRNELLFAQEKQWSATDHREVVIDDRTSTSLSNFTNIFDLMQWRVARQAEEPALCTVDERGKEGKTLTWKKLDFRISSVAIYLKNKVKLKPGDHVILMYTHSEDYVFAVYACMVLGLIAIPVALLDSNRLGEDAPAYLHIVADMNVKAVLVNTEVDTLLKSKPVAQHLKQSAQYLKTTIPPVFNTARPNKQSHGCRDLGLTIDRAWIQPSSPVLIWTYWTPDQRRISVQLGHDTMLSMCKVQKQTFQMTSSKPVLGCVRSTVGIGFLHTCLMGTYTGCTTYLMSPVAFAVAPHQLFLALSRYKVKDTYATTNMLDHAMAKMEGKGFSLHELRNLMIATDQRPRQDIFARTRLHFAQTGLDRTAINTIYSHVLNPMVSSRSYMSIEPIELFLDTRALRRGLVYPVDPDTDPTALCVQDSGMVPVSTQVAIVNPETNQLCHVGEYGEVWMQSEACAKAFYMSRQSIDEERFNGRLAGGNMTGKYVRTGDLGFLHNVTRPVGANNQPVEMQILFILGNIGETFEINGLNHFPVDIENSIQRCHSNILHEGCVVFQAGGMVVVVVEVFAKGYLASMVPVIVNAVLNEHQIIVDIVAFVGKGDFPRSRLNEKQRGKILASWVTRKLRTIAQFGIRDPDSEASILGEAVMGATHRASASTASRQPLAEPRGSIQSDRPLNSAARDGRRSTSPPVLVDLSLHLPPNHYQIDPTGITDRRLSSASSLQQQAQILPSAQPPNPTNNNPYVLPEIATELPTSYHDDMQTSYMSEDFYDPNIEPTESGLSDHLDSPVQARPRLSLVNPDSYDPDSDSNTPTTINPPGTHLYNESHTSQIPNMPSSGVDYPPSIHSSDRLNPTDTQGQDSPYEEAGNPFAFNNTVVEIPTRSAARPQASAIAIAPELDPYQRVASPGRSYLPSQLSSQPQSTYNMANEVFIPSESTRNLIPTPLKPHSRTSSQAYSFTSESIGGSNNYSNGGGNDSHGYNNGDDESSPPPLPPPKPTVYSNTNRDRSPLGTANANSTNASTGMGLQLPTQAQTSMATQQHKGVVPSVLGSVSRRYDGSGYGDYEY